MLGHALGHALSFHSQTISHSITNNGKLLLYTSKFACLLGDKDNTGLLLLTGHMGKYFHEFLQILVNWDEKLRINTDKNLLFLLRRLL